MKKTICFDIDGVICKTITKNYNNSKPILKNIKTINLLYKRKYYIKLFQDLWVEKKKTKKSRK